MKSKEVFMFLVVFICSVFSFSGLFRGMIELQSRLLRQESVFPKTFSITKIQTKCRVLVFGSDKDVLQVI